MSGLQADVASQKARIENTRVSEEDVQHLQCMVLTLQTKVTTQADTIVSLTTIVEPLAACLLAERKTLLDAWAQGVGRLCPNQPVTTKRQTIPSL